MQVLVLNREYAERIQPTKSYLLISISSTHSPKAKHSATSACQGILHLMFDDLYEQDPDLIGFNYFSPYQAELIWEFVESRKAKAKLLIVHCDAGVSRSPAVGAAIDLALNQTDEAFFTSLCYFPNPRVYVLMRQAKEGLGISQQEYTSKYDQLFGLTRCK